MACKCNNSQQTESVFLVYKNGKRYVLCMDEVAAVRLVERNNLKYRNVSHWTYKKFVEVSNDECCKSCKCS